jgi:YfaZ precursor
MLRKALITIILLIPFNNVSAGAVDFRVGRDIAELTFFTQNASFGYGGADIGVGVLFNQYNDVIANGSILVSGNSAGDVKALQFGVGAKIYGGDINGPDEARVDIKGGAVAIGGQIRYVFPGSAPFAVLGEVFYAPEVTSISEFDRLLEYRFALELEVTPSARAYVGYRVLEIDFNAFGSNVNYEVDDSANIGVRFEF